MHTQTSAGCVAMMRRAHSYWSAALRSRIHTRTGPRGYWIWSRMAFILMTFIFMAFTIHNMRGPNPF